MKPAGPYLPSIGTATFPADFNRGYYQSWNVAGTHGGHIHRIVNLNASAPNGGVTGRQLYPFLTTDLIQYTPFGAMTYNGLQTASGNGLGPLRLAPATHMPKSS